MKRMLVLTVTAFVLLTGCAHMTGSTRISRAHAEEDTASPLSFDESEDGDVPLSKIDTIHFDIIRYVAKMEGLNPRGLDYYVPTRHSSVTADIMLRRFGISPWSFRLPIDKPEPSIDRFVNFYLKNPKTVYKGVAKAIHFAPVIIPALESQNLPKELLFLPVIESGYEHSAKSPKSAVGMWQFIESTAEKYGLRVDKWVDERRDPVKSSEAAAKYLRKLYDEFNDWELALAAYNAGEQSIKRAIEKYRETHPDAGVVTYWHIRKYLKKETQDYVPRFYALLRIIRQPELYGFRLDTIETQPIQFDTVVIAQEIPLDTVALLAGVDLQTIRFLNPQYKRGVVKPLGHRGAVVRLPVGMKPLFLSNLTVYLNSASSQKTVVETRTGTENSHNSAENRAQLGTMAMTVSASHSSGPYARERIIEGTRYLAYVVRNGETLEEISRKFNLNPLKLMRINRLTTTMLSPGQVIYLPAEKLSNG